MALRLKRIDYGALGRDAVEPMPAAHSWRLYSAVESGEDDECQLIKGMAGLADQLKASLGQFKA